eukprot:139458-Prymnesium_polylepis.1
MELLDTLIGAGARAVKTMRLGGEILAVRAGPRHPVLGSHGVPGKSTGKTMWNHDLPATINAGVLVLALIGIMHVVLAKAHQRIGHHCHRLQVVGPMAHRTTPRDIFGTTTIPVAFPHCC